MCLCLCVHVHSSAHRFGALNHCNGPVMSEDVIGRGHVQKMSLREESFRDRIPLSKRIVGADVLWSLLL